MKRNPARHINQGSECLQRGITFSKTDITDSNDTKVSVQFYDKHSDRGVRSWKKKHVRLFCYKEISKMARHLISCHRGEIDVQRALDYPDETLVRRAIFAYIMCAGDCYHNLQFLATGRGELIVLRHPCSSDPASSNTDQQFTCLAQNV